MGRNKNLNISNTNPGNSDDSQNLVNIVKKCGENEDERNFEEDSQGKDCEDAKNLKKQHLLNAVQITTKKYETEEEKPDEIKEVKRSRGRPRKVQVEAEIRKNLKKSYSENDDDILKFENEVYENEDTFNTNMENSPSTDINLLSIDVSDSSETVKPVNSASPSFETEAKISTESIITISSEENSNSNPIIRALQNTPSSDRNLSSPDVLQVQFNPSSTKTYKNKQQSVTEEILQKDTQIDKARNQLSKNSPNFEVNPNFVRNTRKKVLKYDVCDLLNKKSHKKIQIEARIDSMPIKSKLNITKTLDPGIIMESNKSAISPTKVVPKINELPSIIRKVPTNDIEYSAIDNSSNMFSSAIDPIPPIKSLIQIQGKIVADNRSVCTKKQHCDSIESIKEPTSIAIQEQTSGLNPTTENSTTTQNTPAKRRPGRPKIKKDNLNISILSETISSNKNISSVIIESSSAEQVESKCKQEKKSTPVTTILEFENTDLVDSDTDNLVQKGHVANYLENKNLEKISTKVDLLNKQNLTESKKYEINSENQTPFIAASIEIDEDCKNIGLKHQLPKEKINLEISTCSGENESSIQNNIENTKSSNVSQMESYFEQVNLNNNKSNETQVLNIKKNIKEVRVLIKGLDNIKLKRQERYSESNDKLFDSSEKLVQEDIDVHHKDIIESTNSIEKSFLSDSVINISTENEIVLEEMERKENNANKNEVINATNLVKTIENVDESKIMEIKETVNKYENIITLDKKVTNHNLNETNVVSVDVSSENVLDKVVTEETLPSEEISKLETCKINIKHNQVLVDAKISKDNNSEETSIFTPIKHEECFNDTINQLITNSFIEKDLTDKCKQVSILPLEKSQASDVLQQIKPKELKTGMDIWLEKVQLETKLKNLHDLTKKYKNEKSQKTKSKEEFKIKSDAKLKSDINFRLESHKNDIKNKEILSNKDEMKLLNSSKIKKDYKEKLDSKAKFIVSKNDSKYKELKSERKLKDKDDIKAKIESKTETKVKTEFNTLKQNLKIDKDESKLKNESKNIKNDPCNQIGKNEVSLKTIDIFNFAAKDEKVQKGYKKKPKKIDTVYQEKIQFTKSDIIDIKNEFGNELSLKKNILLEKSPKTCKEKKNEKYILGKNEDLEKSVENEIIKKKSDTNIEDKSKKRNKPNEEDIDISLNFDSKLSCENEIAHLIETIPGSPNVNKNQKDIILKENSNVDNVGMCDTELPHTHLILEDNPDCKINFDEQLTMKTCTEEVISNLSNQVTNSPLSEIIVENKSPEKLAAKEIDIQINQNNMLFLSSEKDKTESQEINDSTNEVLDPLKDIESFLEAAGNLLSRSHSSDDEKDSLGRRSIRNRNSTQSDDKISFEHFEEENDLSAIKKDEIYCVENITVKGQEKQQNLTLETELVDKIKLKSLSNIPNSEKTKMYDPSLEEKANSSTKVMQRENREEWFSQVDSSIDKDLNDEVSSEQNRKHNELLLIPKKTGTGPRTPPLPPPLSDEELEKSKINNNLEDLSHLYERDNIEKEITNSIISTSIKIPISMATSLHELKFMGSPKNQNNMLDEQLKLFENQINRKSKKKSEASQKDKELKKFLKTLKKNELSGDWKKTYKELKKIKKKSAEGFAISKSSLKYLPENENLLNEENLNLNISQKNKKNSDFQDECNNSNLTIRRSHRLKSIALQQQNQQIAIGRGGLVRNDYEDLIRADLAQVQEQNTKFLKAMENSLNQFKQIKENEYKCERVVSKEAKRMVCDCFLTREEEERGEYGCGEDCLNRLLMIECGPKCNVGDRCTNKRFQRGQYAPCRVFMTEKKGCGIFAEVEIPAGEFIMEYVGEVVDSEQFEKRAAEYSACKNKHFYFMSLRSNAIIDATGRGNISRFINHSCDPNAETQKWTVNGELHIGFFTTRTIALGEEITFDYQFQRYGKQAQKCYCDAVNCRGWIGEEPDSDEEIEEQMELDFKNKEDLENISKDIQSFIDNEKIKKTDENMDDVQKLLNRKEISIDIDKSKSILSEEDFKIKQQEREQRKKDKQRKRELRLAQQKHDFLEDPDLEDEIYRLSKSGLKNQVQTLCLSRLIVRSKLLQTRLNLLEILRAGEIPCRRLFLDYHGLKLLHGWMNESESKDSAPTEDNMKMRLAILETLNCLPIPNKTMLKESKVYQIVHNWAQDKVITSSPTDDFTSDSNSGHAIVLKDKSADTIFDSNSKEILIDIKKLALKLISDWEVLPEVFRIPRKERVEQMKEHEREADRRYAALHVVEDERDSKTTRDRYKKSRWDNSTKQRWTKSDNIKDRRKIDSEKLDDGLTKEQRRQAFAAKVAQDEAEKLNAEKRRNLEFEARREFEFKCKFFLLDCTKTHPRDIPFCVDQKTNSWYTLDKRKIPTPPSHMHIKIPPKTKSTNPADYKIPNLDLPPGWKFAIEPSNGKIYYYHVKIRRSQWEPPPKIYPLATPENNVNNISSGSNIAANTNDNSSDSSESETESIDELDAVTLLVQERAISPRKEEDRIYNQHEMRRYKENKEKIRRRKEEIKRRKARILFKTGEQPLEDSSTILLDESGPLPIADYLISSDEDDDTIVEELDSKLIERIVKGESIVDELDALKIKKPLKRPLPIKDKTNGNSSNNNNSSSSSIASDFKKRSKLEEKKHKVTEELKKSKSTSKNSKYFARKAKEKFRSDIAGIIVQHLQPYRKETCLIGKITTNEDFKHLARKLTHFVMIKELKHCDSTGQTLIVTDSVKNKSREFIKKYMAKYGEIYVRPETDPEYKEIPL